MRPLPLGSPGGVGRDLFNRGAAFVPRWRLGQYVRNRGVMRLARLQKIACRLTSGPQQMREGDR
jgi:hypothetical protein